MINVVVDTIDGVTVMIRHRDGSTSSLVITEGATGVLFDIAPADADRTTVQLNGQQLRPQTPPDTADGQQCAEAMAQIVFTETTTYAIQIPWRVLLDELGEDHDRATITVDDLNNSMPVDALLYDAVNPDCADGSDRKVVSIETLSVHTP